MTQYFLFSYSDYYPSGGAGDCIGVYATLEEARAAVKTAEYVSYDHLEIAVVQDGQLVTVAYWMDNAWQPQEDGTV